ncbi:MAG: GNAT family N-acetyltransferase [Actinomycetota bacterium]
MAAGARLVTLPREQVLEVRPVAEDDIDGLEALYAGLDDDARHRRFFSIYHPPRSFFEKVVRIRERGGLGLVATVRSSGGGPAKIVGEAGYEPLANGDGELAITVDRPWRGWLGPYLLDALLEAAEAEDVPNLEADVLCSNLAMLTMLRCRGYALMPRDDWTVVRLLVRTGTRGTPSWPAPRDAPRLLVEGSGGHWRGVAAAEEAGVQVLGCAGPDAPPGDCPALRGERCPLVEGADAILVSHPGSSEAWEALRTAHAREHPDVPVLVDLRQDDEAAAGEVDVTGRRVGEVLVEMARQVREASTGRPDGDRAEPAHAPTPTTGRSRPRGRGRSPG